MPIARPEQRRDATKIADLRIRASNLGWMLETDLLDQAEREIRLMRDLLNILSASIRERRKL